MTTRRNLAVERRDQKQATLLDLLNRSSAGLTYDEIRAQLGWSSSGLGRAVYQLDEAGAVVRHTQRCGRTVTLCLPGREPPPVLSPELPHAPPAPPLRPDLSGEARSAEKLLRQIENRTARGLASAGGYRLRDAERLIEQIRTVG